MNNNLNMLMLKAGKYFALLLMSSLIIVQGCEDENITTPEPDPVNVQNQTINKCIFDRMEIFYFWNKFTEDVDRNLNPDVFFNSLLSKEDRFSWIQDNFKELLESLMGVNIEAGYDYMLYQPFEHNLSIVMGYITYIKPGTPAEDAGLKRGDLFNKINDTELTYNNYRTLMQQTTAHHTLGLAKIEGNTANPIDNIELSVKICEENPILLDTVYYHIPAKRIGYFVYNFFARDSDENGIEYEKELNELFGKFINEQINELIIDLRYNSGGTVTTALALASMISGLSEKDIFGFEEYNSLYAEYLEEEHGQDYNVMYFLDNIVRTQNNSVVEKVPINKLSGLDRLFLIVSDHTASASEMIINGLRPYMGNDKVILIGEKTTGKNFGSYLFYENNPLRQRTNNWGMLPIVFKLSNIDEFSDYGNGFEPYIQVHEIEEVYDLKTLKPLGDTEELLLKTTLDVISGIAKMNRKNIGKKIEIIGSAIDRTPARKNMYIYDRKNSLSGRD